MEIPGVRGVLLSPPGRMWGSKRYCLEPHIVLVTFLIRTMIVFYFCLQQGGPSVILAPQIAPPDYCGLSWFACLFCFWPTGICAILKSNEVRNRNLAVRK